METISPMASVEMTETIEPTPEEWESYRKVFAAKFQDYIPKQCCTCDDYVRGVALFGNYAFIAAGNRIVKWDIIGSKDSGLSRSYERCEFCGCEQ